MSVHAPLLTVVGSITILIAFVDLGWTTLAAGMRRGPVANHVAELTWRVVRLGSPGQLRREISGVLVLLAVPATWLLMLWAGLWLVFLSSAEAVIDTSSQAPASLLGRLAYAAGSMTGAGASLVAGSAGWQLVNNVGAIAGFVVATLSLTYLLQVVSAVVQERATMASVARLGGRPVDIAAPVLGTGQLGALRDQLSSIAEGVGLAAERHRALPMLQFMHSADRDRAAPVNLARYDEVLTIVSAALPATLSPVISVGHAAVDDFLDTLELQSGSGEVPPAPPLPAEADGADIAAVRRAIDEQAERRRRLSGYLASEGWSWGDVAAHR